MAGYLKMSKELVILNNINNFMLKESPEHKEMLSIISNNLPDIQKKTTLFGKTQSQFMDNLLTVSHPTPLRNVRQILSEIQRSRSALREAYFNNEKTQIEIEILLKELSSEQDDLKAKLIQNDIDSKMSQLEESKLYVSGAVRKITNYILQYKSILKSLGKEELTESDFEEEEEKYHIMKSFEQALSAARSHQGIIDEGNHIYLSQIGINGTVAQREISNYFAEENKFYKDGKEPTYEFQKKFLENMYTKFKGCSTKLTEMKNMTKVTDEALIKNGTN